MRANSPPHDDAVAGIRRSVRAAPIYVPTADRDPSERRLCDGHSCLRHEHRTVATINVN